MALSSPPAQSGRGHLFLNPRKLPYLSALALLDARHSLLFLDVLRLLWEVGSPAPIILQFFLSFSQCFAFASAFYSCFTSIPNLAVNPIRLTPLRGKPGQNSDVLVSSYLSGLCFRWYPFPRPPPHPLRALGRPVFSPPPTLLSPLTEDSIILPLRLCWVTGLALTDPQPQRGAPT